MLKESELVRPLKNQVVQCRVCEHFCTLRPEEWGRCGVRVNRGGKIYLTVYGKAVAVHIDPIEKKPLYHFLPGGRALSIGTLGCNMRCRWCQNWEISQTRPHDLDSQGLGQDLLPEQLVDIAVREGVEAIAYTYNEPTVFFEYTYDTAVLAYERGIKNIYVSNGFMSSEVLERLSPYLDSINIDLKGFTEAFYQEYTGARLAPVKRNIKTFAQETQTWVEVTTLVIPGLNDSDEELRACAEWLSGINPDIPWHISAFHPAYEMQDRPRTPPSTLERAYQIGQDAGLHFVYVGNIWDPTRESTYCPNCGALLIRRSGFNTHMHWQMPGVCPKCGTHIPGVWS
ncbi:MAG: AmmeMemoRadiSam system radical SAM enzyme [Anaerolineae bacterium]|nr:AmmeMemoRadiSam system radical SAM enzyme [Anaerolineae bacterium]